MQSAANNTPIMLMGQAILHPGFTSVHSSQQQDVQAMQAQQQQQQFSQVKYQWCWMWPVNARDGPIIRSLNFCYDDDVYVKAEVWFNLPSALRVKLAQKVPDYWGLLFYTTIRCKPTLEILNVVHDPGWWERDEVTHQSILPLWGVSLIQAARYHRKLT